MCAYPTSSRYFDLRGLGEIARVILAIAKVEYKDVRYPIDVTTFARPEFDKDSAAGVFDVNMCRLPILEVDGWEIGQSRAIERFLARRHGLMGSNDLEAAYIDCLSEHVRDIKQKYADARAGKKDEALAEAKANFLSNELPKWLEKLEKCLKGDGFAVGDKISLADINIHSLIADYFDDKEAALAACANCPKLLASTAKVQEAAGEWFETRPKTAF